MVAGSGGGGPSRQLITYDILFYVEESDRAHQLYSNKNYSPALDLAE